jgi:hypothetical protein
VQLQGHAGPAGAEIEQRRRRQGPAAELKAMDSRPPVPSRSSRISSCVRRSSLKTSSVRPHQHRPDVRQRDAFGAAHEQGGAQALLHVAHGMRDRRLRQVLPRRRAQAPDCATARKMAICRRLKRHPSSSITRVVFAI